MQIAGTRLWSSCLHQFCAWCHGAIGSLLLILCRDRRRSRSSVASAPLSTSSRYEKRAAAMRPDLEAYNAAKAAQPSRALELDPMEYGKEQEVVWGSPRKSGHRRH